MRGLRLNPLDWFHSPGVDAQARAAGDGFVFNIMSHELTEGTGRVTP
jgi:hypothetical protein